MRQPGVANDEPHFFLCRAQTFRENIRDAQLRANLACDPRSPSIVRMSRIVRNMYKWCVAFDVRPSDALHFAPKDRMRGW